MKTALYSLVLLFIGSAAQAWDVQPYGPPISCEANYYCAGDEHFRGKVTSKYRFWNKAECKASLQNQVAGQCRGQTLLSEIAYRDHTSTTSDGSACPDRGYYYPWAALSGHSGGYGASMSSTKSDAENKAYYRSCAKYGGGCRTVSIKNGCVAYVHERIYWRDYFGTGCSANSAERAALASCRGICNVKEVYCADR